MNKHHRSIKHTPSKTDNKNLIYKCNMNLKKYIRKLNNIMHRKTYTEFIEGTEELEENRLVRSGAVLYYAAQVRTYGRALEQNMRSAQSKVADIKRAEYAKDKLDLMADLMDDMCDAILNERKMIGSLTGVGVSAGILAERTDKEIKKLLKGKGRR